MIVALACLALLWLGPDDWTDRELAFILEHSPLGDVPPDPTNAVADDPRAAHLGRFLFFDTRLSPSGKVSCATCHEPQLGFADAKPLPTGLGPGHRNAQSLWNVAYNEWFFWDGRADSLWAQATHPIESAIELGGSRLQLAHLIHDDPDLREAYQRIFGALPDLSDAARFPAAGCPDPSRPKLNATWEAMDWDDRQIVNEIFANVCKSIAAYERRLVSRNAPFDQYVQGLRNDDPDQLHAISDEAKLGLRIFVGKGNCRLCHSGPTFSDKIFHAGLVPPLDGGMPSDSGRYAGVDVIKQNPFSAAGAFNDDPNRHGAARLRGLHRDSHDWGAFKTPTLRNVALSAPYMHQGQLAELEDVARFYSTLDGALDRGLNTEMVLRPLNLSEDEIAALTAFLESLTDVDVDPELLEAPISPIAD